MNTDERRSPTHPKQNAKFAKTLRGQEFNLALVCGRATPSGRRTKYRARARSKSGKRKAESGTRISGLEARNVRGKY